MWLVKNIIDHALYALQRKPDNYILILGLSTENFLCDYSTQKLFNNFIVGTNKYF